MHNKFHTLLLSTVFEIIPKESKIFQQECFRHKQMLPKKLSSIRNSSSKKKNSIQTIKLYHLRLIFRQLKYISSLLYWSRRFIMLLWLNVINVLYGHCLRRLNCEQNNNHIYLKLWHMIFLTIHWYFSPYNNI